MLNMNLNVIHLIIYTFDQPFDPFLLKTVKLQPWTRLKDIHIHNVTVTGIHSTLQNWR